AFDTDEASDGRVALAKAISRRPDIVVADSRLPGINGYDLCRLLRHDTATRQTPIVVITPDDESTGLVQARAAGADMVLARPCEPDVLLKEVWELIRLSRELRERSRAIQFRIAEERAKSAQLNAAAATSRRVSRSASFQRHFSTSPPTEPPAVFCPKC